MLTYNAITRGLASVVHFIQSQLYGYGRQGSPLQSTSTSNANFNCNKPSTNSTKEKYKGKSVNTKLVGKKKGIGTKHFKWVDRKWQWEREISREIIEV